MDTYIKRPPVIVVMGHIDHGKSTLLDYIRSTNIVAKEAGGITQHLSAYEVVHTHEGEEKKVTFIDTPGHEAFQAMRSRGAKVGDVAILVVAADDGVKTQTKEALFAIQESGIPYLVAINKMDKIGADLNRTIATLIENEIYLEGYGGDIPYVPISAKTGLGIADLLDTVILLSDIQELVADIHAPGEGIVIESHVDPKSGIAATLIIKNGTVNQGDTLVCGESLAPVRVMQNFMKKTIKTATVSAPIQLYGFTIPPCIGATFTVYKDKKEAQKQVEHAKHNKEIARNTDYASLKKSLIPVIIKTDVSGTIDAILHELNKLETNRACVKIVGSGIGSISEADIKLAQTTGDVVILGFNTTIERNAKDLAERSTIEFKLFSIIYELATWMQDYIEQKTPKQKTDEVIGTLKVLKTFSRNKSKTVAGGRVETGIISSNTKVKIYRRDEYIGVGVITGVQQQKVEVVSVSEGLECGLLVDSKWELAPGDLIEAFVIVEK